jgi:hypothetical protein
VKQDFNTVTMTLLAAWKACIITCIALKYMEDLKGVVPPTRKRRS